MLSNRLRQNAAIRARHVNPICLDIGIKTPQEGFIPVSCWESYQSCANRDYE